MFPRYLYILILCLVCIIHQSTAAFTVIIDAAGFETESFPVNDLVNIEYSYATPSYDSKWALIVTDLKDTNFVLRACYIGGGEVDESRYYFSPETEKAYLKVEVQPQQFFSLYCTFQSPKEEQDGMTAYFSVYEVHRDDNTSAQTYAQEIESGSISEDLSVQVVSLSFDLLPVFTDTPVFAHHYTFVPDEFRLLLNSTEIDLLKQYHFQTSTSMIVTVDDVIIMDYWTEDQPNDPQSNPIIHIILHIRGTNSELDFQRNVGLHVQQRLNAWEIPLTIASIEAIQRRYLSHCFNNKQDFDEPAVDCGSPSVTNCGRCYLPDITCSQHSDCVSGDCSQVSNKCDLDPGHRIKKDDSASSLSVLAVALIVAFVIANVM